MSSVFAFENATSHMNFLCISFLTNQMPSSASGGCGGFAFSGGGGCGGGGCGGGGCGGGC